MITKCDSAQVQYALFELKRNPVKNIYGISYICGFPDKDDYYKLYKTNSGYFLLMGDTLHLFGYDDANEIASFIGVIGAKTVYDYMCSGSFGTSYRAEIYALHTSDKLVSANNVSMCVMSDEDNIYRIWKDFFPGTPDKESFDITATEQRCYLNGKRCKITEDSKIVSTASILMENDTTSLLGGIVTDEKYRGRGYAAQTVSYMASGIIKSGKTPVVFTVNDTAKRLYKNLGFELSGNIDIIKTDS